MALGLAFLTGLALLGFCLGFASFGNFLLRGLSLELESDTEHLLVSIAAGLTASEILLFLTQFTQHMKAGCWVSVAVLGTLSIVEWRAVLARSLGALLQTVPRTRAATLLWLFIGAVLLVEFLCALAPLTGSDALNYHFAAQRQILSSGFHPVFSNSLSFLCGQHHLLILMGLAFGSERLALGLIFLGGVLTAGSVACLASKWTSNVTAMLFALALLLTPVAFWQITSSGCPDIYMAFLASTAVLVLGRKGLVCTWRQPLLVGFLAGGIAGAKYSGCFIAGALALALIVELRTAAGAFLFFLGSLASGVWPYLRNFLWTGNPVFPFLSGEFLGGPVSPYALANIYANTAASPNRNLTEVLSFAFFAGIRRSGPGLWEFFGPLILILAPLMFLAFRNDRRWRAPLLVWFASSLAISVSSGLPRYILPVFPLALSCGAAGFELPWRRDWIVAKWITAGLLVLTLFISLGGFQVYFRPMLRVAVGLQDKSAYLRERGPEYQIAQAINESLAGRVNDQKTLVFLRHLYYLDIPYVNGDPGTSFELNPDKMRSREDWRAYFAKNNIGYVVRSPEYPRVIAGPLEEMEQTGELTPIARAEVQSFQGKRVDEVRAATPVVILKVKR